MRFRGKTVPRTHVHRQTRERMQTYKRVRRHKYTHADTRAHTLTHTFVGKRTEIQTRAKARIAQTYWRTYGHTDADATINTQCEYECKANYMAI